jgi:drug/metabolite transporter (DMT)-like permease
VAVVFSLFMLVTRQLAKDTDPVALQLVSGGMACAMLLPLSAMAVWLGWGPMAMVDPGAQGWGLLLAMGLLGTAAHLLMTWSLRYAPSATLAPMQYLEIPVATLIGLLVFGDFPNGLALVGIIVTMGAGLYIIGRERTVARRADG